MTDKLTSPAPYRLVLASRSPRRAELLTAAGIAFVSRSVEIDETQLPVETAETYVQRLSREKALAAVSPSDTNEVVLGADTTVVIDGQVLGKPVDVDDAIRMLDALSGRWHEVLTGVTLLRASQSRSEVASTRVKFATLTAQEIRWYVTSREPFDKAGGYAIQGRGSLFVEQIAGSYSNVVGLPLETVYRLASELGVDLLAPGLSRSV